MPEEIKILLGFTIGCLAYCVMEILAGLWRHYHSDSQDDPSDTSTRRRFSLTNILDSATPRRRVVFIVFYFAGGVSCLFIGKYLLGVLFVLLGLAIRAASKGYGKT